MGKRLASILTGLSAADRALVDEYAAALRRAGVSDKPFACKLAMQCVPEAAGASVLGNRLRAARRFLEQWGLDGWRHLPADEQATILLADQPANLSMGYRTFVAWLGLTGRAPWSADLLAALEARGPRRMRWLEQGRLAFPELLDRVTAAAHKLGYGSATADQIAAGVTQAVAHTGKSADLLVLDDLLRISETLRRQRIARRVAAGEHLQGAAHQPLVPWTTGTVLYHAGLLPEPPATTLIGRRDRPGLEEAQLGFLRDRWPQLHQLAMHYLARRRTLVKPSTVKHDTLALGYFLRWLTTQYPAIQTLAELDRRTHVEPLLHWVIEEAGPGRRRGQAHWLPGTQRAFLIDLQHFFQLLRLWDWPEAPTRPLLLSADLPRLPKALPRAFDDLEAARMVQIARGASNTLQRLVIELLAGCGLRAGEARALKLCDIVTFGGPANHPAAQPWLRVPLGKLGNDRYVPIGSELQAALDAFLGAERSTREWEELPTPPPWTAYLLARKGRRISTAYCNQVVHRLAAQAGVADAHAHRWRHTFATQAINRGMDLATIATLLGHASLEMTMVYARIASPTLRREFERVSHQVQAFYTAVASDPPGPDTPTVLPAGALGPAMTVTRRELEWRRLGNGWCTRRAYIDCRYELVCERCVHFNTDRLFLPVLEAQHEDATRKGQQARIEVLGRLITTLNATQDADALALVSGPSVADFSQPKSEGLA